MVTTVIVLLHSDVGASVASTSEDRPSTILVFRTVGIIIIIIIIIIITGENRGLEAHISKTI